MSGVVWQNVVNQTVLDHYDNNFAKAMPLMRNTVLARVVAAARVLLEHNDQPDYVRAVTDMAVTMTGVEDPALIQRLIVGELVTDR